MLKKVFYVAVAAAVAFGAIGCSKLKTVTEVKSVVIKDVPLEDQLKLLDEYKGKHAWTRATLADLTERVDNPNEPRRNTIPRDTKVTIMDLNLVYSGTVTVEDSKGKRVVAALNCERPLTPEGVQERLNELFWFEDPTIRHVEYIRKWGKRTARSVMNHEVFAGMPAEAARESWGIPDEVTVNEVGTEKEERWTYREGKRSKKIFIIDGLVGRWEE